MILIDATARRRSARALALLCIIGLAPGTSLSQPTIGAAPSMCRHARYLACDTRQKLNHDAANGIRQRLAATPEGTGPGDIAETKPDGNGHVDIA